MTGASVLDGYRPICACSLTYYSGKGMGKKAELAYADDKSTLVSSTQGDLNF